MCPTLSVKQNGAQRLRDFLENRAIARPIEDRCEIRTRVPAAYEFKWDPEDVEGWWRCPAAVLRFHMHPMPFVAT